MENKHGVSVKEKATSTSTPSVAPVSIPFVIGAAPIQSALTQALVSEPVVCMDLGEARELFGYSDDWKKYNICEFLYSHFELYRRGPVIVCNLLDITKMSASVSAADVPVADKRALLPLEAIDDENLIVKAQGGTGSAYVKGEDYETFYAGENLVIELMRDSTHFDDASINVAYRKVTPESVTNDVVAAGLENIEKCLGATGYIPDLIWAAPFSTNPIVASAMATKCKINGIFAAKALVDLSTVTAKTHRDAIALKKQNNTTDVNQIVCWPMLGKGDKVFHMSTHLAGVMATVDAGNSNVPYESPSNKPYNADAIILADGTAINLTQPEANFTEGHGIVTALRFINGLVCWGNYTACRTISSDVKDYFISVNRMFDFVGNTFIRTHWRNLDKPQIPRLIDSIVDGTNIWLNGLTGAEFLLGANVTFREGDNKLEDIMAGRIKVHIAMTPPPPLMEIEASLEYDVGPFVSMASA